MTNIYRFMSSEICIAVSSSSISLRLKLKNSTVGPYFLPWPSANVSYSRVCTDFWIHNSRLFPYFFPKTIISFSRLRAIGDLTYHSSLAGTKHTRKHLASPQTSFGIRLSCIHFSPTDVCYTQPTFTFTNQRPFTDFCKT